MDSKNCICRQKTPPPPSPSELRFLINICAVYMDNIERTPPMIYTVSLTDKMLDFKLKIYGQLYSCLPETDELD